MDGMHFQSSGNALERVHEPADLWDITFCTRWFWDFYYYVHPLYWDPELFRMHLHPQIQIPNAFTGLVFSNIISSTKFGFFMTKSDKTRGFPEGVQDH